MMYSKMELKRADYEYWNYVSYVTLNEFIYLAAGCHPLDAGMYGNAYLNLSNAEFKEYYKKIKRLGEELPQQTTEETIVQERLPTRELKYEAAYLVKFFGSRNILINSSYKPSRINAEERKILINNTTRNSTLSNEENLIERIEANDISNDTTQLNNNNIKKQKESSSLLHRLIEEIFNSNPTAKNEEIWAQLHSLTNDMHTVIQEVSDWTALNATIAWQSAHKEQNMRKKPFNLTFQKLEKNIKNSFRLISASFPPYSLIYFA